MIEKTIEMNYENYLKVKDNEDSLIKFCGNIIALFPNLFNSNLLAIKHLREKKYGKSPETIEFLALAKVNYNEKYAEVLLKSFEVFFELQNKEGKVYKMFFK